MGQQIENGGLMLRVGAWGRSLVGWLFPSGRTIALLSLVMVVAIALPGQGVQGRGLQQSIAQPVALSVTGGAGGGGGGLKPYTDAARGYRFFYPVGWVQVKVNNGPEVVFRDIIHDSENVSVVINPVPKDKKLSDLGSATDVGYRLSKSAIAPPDSGRTAELLNAVTREVEGKTYYLFEYAVQLPHQLRHDLASVVISRGNLFTLNVSTPEARWKKVKSLFDAIIQSFQVD